MYNLTQSVEYNLFYERLKSGNLGVNFNDKNGENGVKDVNLFFFKHHFKSP